MQSKIILLLIFAGIFSLHGLSQTDDKSEHPLLDKYYPQKQKTDTPKIIKDQIQQGTPVKTTFPVSNIGAHTSKPVAIIPVIPVDTTTAMPKAMPATVHSIKTTPAITSTSNVASVSHLTNTPVVNKQDTVTVKLPVQVKPQPQRTPGQLYIDTRLGSSTPQYDTWQKNNNGAGSVTTSPK